MSRVQTLFDLYSQSHQNFVNKVIHWICVPSIVFSLFAMLWWLPRPGLPPQSSVWINWASLVFLLVQLYYFRLSRPLFLAMIPVGIVVLGACEWLSASGVNLLRLGATVFVVAWIGQFIGHHIEGKRPSFLQDLQFLLIGPAWLLGFIFRGLGLKY